MSSHGECKPCIVASAPLNVAEGVMQSVEYLNKALMDYAEVPTKPWRTALDKAIAQHRALSVRGRANIPTTLRQQFISAAEARVTGDSSQVVSEQQEFLKRLNDIQALQAEARKLVDDCKN